MRGPSSLPAWGTSSLPACSVQSTCNVSTINTALMLRCCSLRGLCWQGCGSMPVAAHAALSQNRAPNTPTPHRQADPQTEPDTHGTNWCCFCCTEPRPRPPARQPSPSASTACARARSVTRLRSRDSPAAWHGHAQPRAARGREARGRAPPVVGVVVPVVQRLDALGALAPRQLVRVRALEESGASSTSHLGSIAHTSRMYSLLVSTSSW